MLFSLRQLFPSPSPYVSFSPSLSLSFLCWTSNLIFHYVTLKTHARIRTYTSHSQTAAVIQHLKSGFRVIVLQCDTTQRTSAQIKAARRRRRSLRADSFDAKVQEEENYTQAHSCTVLYSGRQHCCVKGKKDAILCSALWCVIYKGPRKSLPRAQKAIRLV